MEYINLSITGIFLKFRNLILYGIFGGIAASIDFLIFHSLTTYLQFHYLFANFISVVIGITISFLLNKNFNFKVKDKPIKRYLIFLSVGAGGLILSSFLLYLFIDILTLEKSISKFLSIVLVVGIQFLLNKYITFKRSNSEK